MDLLQKLAGYLASCTYEGARFTKEEAPSYPFITISREAGAGGHSLANALLAEMAQRRDPLFTGWSVFDAAACARILEDVKIQASLESLDREETRTPWEETVYELVGGQASTERVFWKTFQAMKILAKMGKIIIIGRGGACATSDLPLGIHIRLVAPMAARIDCMKTQLEISRVNAARLVDIYDLERAKFVQTHFGKEIEDPVLYHAVWNSGRMAMEEMAQQLVGMVERRALPAAVSAG